MKRKILNLLMVPPAFIFMAWAIINVLSCQKASTDDRSLSRWIIWTAPYPGNHSSLVGYDLRYTLDSTLPMDSWIVMDGAPSPPGPEGTIDSAFGVELPEGISFCRLRSVNRHGLWSEWSNIAVKDICSDPPSLVIDLQ